MRKLGFLQQRSKQRTDALGMIGAVRELSQLERLWEALRLALRGLLVADAAWVERVVPVGLPHAVPGAAVGLPTEPG